jgi:hypothetical protein
MLSSILSIILRCKRSSPVLEGGYCGTMSAVTIDEAWPGFGRAFTVAELDRMAR